MVGDWNATPDAEEWKALRTLEKNQEIAFETINKETEVSHLVRLNASGPAGSRLDLHLINDEAGENAVVDKKGVVIKWSPFNDLATMVSGDRKTYFAALKERFSDHLPVVSRFYLTENP
jgi:hypothetical protein